jgi:hypothetical protein
MNVYDYSYILGETLDIEMKCYFYDEIIRLCDAMIIAY